MAGLQDHREQLHFVLFPLMAQGHMIPMIDMARLLAERGVIVTIILTPLNILRFKRIIDRAVESGLQIRVLQLRFPCIEAGLPEGCENTDSMPSLSFKNNFFAATLMLQEPLEHLFAELRPLPNCIVSDMAFPWTDKLARKFEIPRIVFHGTCCFSLLCSHNILKSEVLESVTSELDSFIVPCLPDRIELTKAKLPNSVCKRSEEINSEIHDQIKEAELTAYGVVVNSFHELEPRYVEAYSKVKSDKVWCIGPVSLCNKEKLDKTERGKNSSVDENSFLQWLDSRDPSSVVYACFGSLCQLTTTQLIEVGLGLEASGSPFIWVIKGEKYAALEKWLSEEGFQERTKERGLVIKGWAPQVLILSHRSIGGFLTHCGWNSILEGISVGVPQITWPMFAEQFINEKLIVQVLGIGVAVGVDVPVDMIEAEKVEGVGKKEDVEKAVKRIMDESDESKERRRKVRELAEMAKKATEEGGSSHFNITLLIQDIMKNQASKKLIQSS